MEKTVSSTVKVQRPVLRHKMYKSGKSWVVAGVMGVATGTIMLTATASADTVSGSAAPETSTAPAATQTVANTTTMATTEAAPAANANQLAAAKAVATTAAASQSISQPIKVDSSALSNAVSAASQAGLNPTYDSSAVKSYVSSNDSQTASYASQIKSDYASQANKINQSTKQYLHDKSNYDTYNESQGNHSALDAAASAAAQVPGLTVTKDQDKVTSGVNASDDTAISNWSSSTATDYASQVDAINKAIAAQKQKNTEYEQKLKDYGNYLNGNSTLDPTKVMQGLHLNATAESSTIEDLQQPDKITPAAGNHNADRWYNSNRSGDFLRAIYYNPAQSYYVDFEGNVHKIGKVVVTYSNLVVGPQSNQWNTTNFEVSPTEIGVIDSFYLKSVTATYDFYDENGNYINFEPGSAWVFLSSLGRWSDWNDSSKKNNPAYDHVEAVQGVSGIKMYDIPNGGAVVHSGNNAYPDSGQQYESDGKTSFDNPYDHQQGAVIGYISNGLKLRWNLDRNYSPIDNGVMHSLRYDKNGNKIQDAGDGGWYYWRFVQSYNGFEMLQPPTSSVSYHYNELKTNDVHMLRPDELTYHYDTLTQTTTPDKNWTQGDQVVNGKTEINDDTVSATVKMDYQKPSNLAGGLTKLSVGDNYAKMADKVTYQGAQVYENDTLATSKYNVTNNAADATVTATRKDASTAPGGTVSLVVDFKVKNDVPSGTKLVNSGSGTINNSTVPTKDVQMVTYNQTAEKHWMEGTQTVDGKTYINDDVVTTKVDMSLPDPSTLAHSLTNVTIDDNYSDFTDKVKLQSYRVEENGKDVTSQYTITTTNGHLTAVRKDASQAPQGKVSLIATWQINSNVPSGTTFTNRGSGRINNHTVDTNTPSIKTYTQTADKHWVEGGQTVDDKTYINNDVIHGQVEMSLPSKSDLAKPLTDVTLTDDYTDYAKNVTYQSAQVLENGKDVTSEYTIANANGKVVATRKTPGDAPSGNVQLIVNFKINDNIPAGTTFTNRGAGRINNHTVNTNNAKVVTYQQTTDKHWMSGTQIVDGKTYVDGDTVNGQVSMSLPNPTTLAKPLSKVQIVDDYSNFKDKADYVSAKVYENGVDATDKYTITNDSNTGTVTAVRKDASTAPQGTVVLSANWKVHQNVASGTKLVNGGSGTINDSTVKTPDRTIVTYSQETTKNWIEGNTVVNGKTYIDNDDITAQVTVKMPDRDNLAENLNKVVIKDDYSNFKDKAKIQSVKVYENGKDVTSQYDIKNDASTGLVTATRLDPKSAPSGTIQMNVVWKINSDVASGTIFKNTPISTLNGHDVTGTPVEITGYKPKTDKNFVEGSQVVNDKTYIDSDVINAKIDMSLPDPSTLAKPLSKVELVDDYGQMARYVSAPTSVQVLENGKDVTSEYTITTANGKVTATRKDPSKAPAGSVSLLAKFKINADTPSGTQLVNAGSGTLNNETVPTPTPTVETYKQTTDKHWTEGSQDVDGKVYVSGDQTQADVTMTLPDPAKLAKPLSKVQVADDYTNFKDKADFVSATVYENGKDVTDQYTITHDNGKVVATRKDASKTPQGTVDLHTVFKLHSDVADKTVFVNNGSGTINDETIATPSRTVTIFKQTTDKHWTEGSQVVDDKTYIADDTVNAEISTNLPDPSTLAKKLSKVQLTDDFTNFKDNVDFVSATVYENGADVTSLYTITNANGKVVAVRKDPSNAPAGTAKLDVKFKIHDDVKSGTVFKNTGDVLINDSDVSTPSPKIVTYKQTTDKHWVEGDQVVDGKTFISGDKVTGQVSMSLPDKNQLAKPLSKVELVDDYSNFKDKANYVSARVYEGDQDVTDQYTITDVDGKVTAVRKDASKTPSGSAKLVVTWQVHTDVASGTKLINAGSGTINGSTVKTPDRTIVTYKQNTDKHWTNNGQVVDGKVAINGDTVTAQVNMTLPKGTNLGGSINKVQLTDDFSKFANAVVVAAVHVYENGIDVTDQYNVSIDPNGKVVATRKDPSKVDLTGGVSMTAEMKANKTLNASNVVTSATAKVNDTKATTKVSAVSTPLAPDSSISVTDGQIKSQVNVNVPSGTDVKNFAIADDYSHFSNAADASQAKVYENGKDATDQYTITNKDGKVVAVRKTTDGMSSGSVSMVIDYKLKHDIANGTVLENHGSGTINGETVETNTPSITTYTQSADKHWVDGDQVVDGKVYVDGSTATAKVTTSLPDPSKLTAPLTDITLTDDYSAFANKVDLTNVQVLENGKDATNEYTITKENGKIVATRKDASKAPAGNAQLITTFKIHAGVENGTQLVNTGSSTINKHTVSTNTAVITTFKPNPTKDAVVSVDNNTSLSNIPLNTKFNYKLVGSTLPKNSNAITEYGFVDDYDQEHDQYNGGYTVLLNSDVTLTDGTVLKKGTDVTKYTTQVVDQANGKATIEFDKDFLSKIDFAKSEFGATAYLKMKRVKVGNVENSYDNTINGETFKSNTIKTHTDEPKTDTPKNETPKTETPKSTTPATPVSTPLQSTAQPQMAAMATPALAQPQQKSEQQALPQTGNAKDEREALLGAAILGIVGATMIPVRRKRYGA